MHIKQTCHFEQNEKSYLHNILNAKDTLSLRSPECHEWYFLKLVTYPTLLGF